MNTIYCFNNGGSAGFQAAIGIAEDGNCLAQHLCSHEGFMKHDLGMTSDWKHENYNEHYGKGNWQLEWIESNDIDSHEGLQKAFKLNAEISKAND